MEMHPLVSIVLCTNNGQAYLAEQLQSLEKQTYKNVEVICSDNNSTDATPGILQEWCRYAANRKFITTAEKGLNKNFFNAMQHATGEYIIFCDQDDIWLPDKIKRLVDFHLLNKDASLVYCLSKPFTGPLPAPIVQMRKGVNRLEGSEIKQTLLISFTLGHNILIRRKILQQIPVPLNETVAYDWWITVSAMCIAPVKCLEEELTYWRQHPANTTKKLNEDLFFKSRAEYLTVFETNKLINSKDKLWIAEARKQFLTLTDKRFSFPLFSFLFENAAYIFFYKRKHNLFSKWVSYFKWSLRMSGYEYRP